MSKFKTQMNVKILRPKKGFGIKAFGFDLALGLCHLTFSSALKTQDCPKVTLQDDLLERGKKSR
jgi:hypothetical protein